MKSSPGSVGRPFGPPTAPRPNWLWMILIDSDRHWPTESTQNNFWKRIDSLSILEMFWCFEIVDDDDDDDEDNDDDDDD